MRNKHITLGNTIPDKLRLKIYKEALSFIISDQENEKDWPHSLCLLLPCVLWYLENYLDDGPGEGWMFTDTKLTFVEIEPYLKNLKTIPFGPLKDAERIRILTEIIENLEKQLL